MNIYIGDFSPEVTGEDLKAAFVAFGRVTFVQVIKNRFTGNSGGFGFVEMPNKAEAKKAIEKITQINGERITVNEADPNANYASRGESKMGKVNQV